MKIFHLSDLHLGKRVCSHSLNDDQRHILNLIIEHIEAEQPDAVMIAGDVYDRATPSEDAVEMFDDFLYKLSELGVKTLITGGNHDSEERLAFGGRIFNKSGIFISPKFDGTVTRVTLTDTHGEVEFYLLPFVTPTAVRRFFENESIEDCTDAVRAVISQMGIDPEKRNVLVAHQFVTGAVRTEESETYFVGDAENVDASVFAPFDYVALGHLHSPQSVERASIRYCGTPMKYSFAEAEGEKSITVLELAEKGNLRISEIPLVPLQDWKVIEGSFDDVIKKGCGDFVKVILTDDDDIYDAMNKLRNYFPNILQMDYKRSEGELSYSLSDTGDAKNTTPAELFEEFYKLMNGGKEPNERQKEIVSEVLGALAGGDV